MGLPGFSGFVAEISVIIGLWQAYPWLTIGWRRASSSPAHSRCARCIARFSPARPAGARRPAKLPPLTWPEISAIALLLAVSLAIGIYPKPWVALIDDGLRSPLFQSILSLP
jgi:NADH-quinone oxidoreductase subunit M